MLKSSQRPPKKDGTLLSFLSKRATLVPSNLEVNKDPENDSDSGHNAGAPKMQTVTSSSRLRETRRIIHDLDSDSDSDSSMNGPEVELIELIESAKATSTDITSSDSQIQVSACTDIVGTPFSPEPEPEPAGVVSVQSRTDSRPKRVRTAVQTTFSSCCDRVIDRAARMRADVVECGRKGCKTRWVCNLLTQP